MVCRVHWDPSMIYQDNHIRTIISIDDDLGIFQVTEDPLGRSISSQACIPVSSPSEIQRPTEA